MTKILKPVCLGVVLALVLWLGAVVLPVSARPIGVDFSATPTLGNAPLTVQFTNLSEIFTSNGLALASFGYTWLWDFGDGGTSTEESPTYTYNRAGVYDVSLTRVYENGNHVQNENGGDTRTRYDYITVYPVADFSASPTQGQAPLTVNFSDKSKGYPSSWHWGFGDGGTSSQQNPIYTYNNPGTYTVSLTVTGSTSTKTRGMYIVVEEAAVRPDIVVRNLEVAPAYAQPRQAVTINANVVNEGGMWGSDTVNLTINGQFEQSQSVGVSPGSASPVSFTIYKVEAGTYSVAIGDATGTFYVMEEAATPAPKGGLLAGGELDTGGIIAIVVIGIILIGGIVVAVLLTRRA